MATYVLVIAITLAKAVVALVVVMDVMDVVDVKMLAAAPVEADVHPIVAQIAQEDAVMLVLQVA